MSSAPPPVAPGRGRLPAQTRDRRAALSALALLLIVAGALGSALVVYRAGHRTDVLIAAREIKPGQRLTSADFATARVATDSGSVVQSADESNFVGTFATTDIPAGTLVNRLMFQAGSMLPKDGVVVGVTLARSQRPAAAIASGDVLRAFQVPRTSSGDTAVAGSVLVDSARVVAVSDGSSSGDSITVSLLVTQVDAAKLIPAAGQGSVAVGELPKTVKPLIDFQTTS